MPVRLRVRPLCPIIDRVHCCVLILLRNNFKNLFVGKEEEGFVCPWDQTGLGIPGFLGGNYVYMFPCEKLEALIVLVELSKRYLQLYSDLNPNSVCQYCSCGLSV